MNWQDFHFLRPYWFVALVPVALILLAMWRRIGRHHVLDKLCDPELLQHLWLEQPGKLGRWVLALLAAGWLLAIVALAGPVWERQPQPVFRAEAARVIVLDLSPSMEANDLVPSRIERARFKLADILDRSTEGRTGLVVFAAEAHIVTPLTSDTATIETMIPALQTGIMPAAGDNAASGLRMAQSLLQRAGAKEGEVLLLSDGMSDAAEALMVAAELRANRFRLSVLGTATDIGAPMPDGQGGFRGMAQIDQSAMQALATAGGGRFVMLQPDDADLNRVLQPLSRDTAMMDSADEAKVERWKEQGIWLLPLVLLLASAGLRRGWLGAVLVVWLLPPPGYAIGWDDLWWRQDQQALRNLNAGQPGVAATQFSDPAWRGAALYHAEQYAEAAQALEGLTDQTSRYNRANALTMAGQFDDAIALYEQLLSENPEMDDARHNLEIAKKKKNEQEKQKQQSDQDDQQSNGDNPPQPQPDSQNPDGNGNDENSQPEPPPEPEQQSPGQEQGEDQSDPAVNEPLDNGKTMTLNSEPDKDVNPQDEQWLRQVPDDPAALLRNKFMLEHLRRQQQEQK